MKLFHAFPRPPHRTDSEKRVVREKTSDDDRLKGLEVLRLILTHGLLCTPEKFKLYPNYNTLNAEKQEILREKRHHDMVIQSRACFTLADSLDLSKEYELLQDNQPQYASHTDLFGEFAIGLDPLDARELGIMPTVYYYRHDIENPYTRMAGLGSQIVERLDEIKCLFSVLSYIEAKAHNQLPQPEILRSMGVEVRYQKDIEAALAKLKPEDTELIFRLFNTDRVPAWNLVDFIGIMLSLYQTTDSTIEDAPLAFFQQREWRLVHHMMRGLTWFGIGDHPPARDPLANQFRYAKEEIKKFLYSVFSKKGKHDLTWFFNHSWVLEGTDELHFRDYVREIVVPERFCEEAQNIVNSLDFVSTPTITCLPPKWRITTENGIPRITQTTHY